MGLALTQRLILFKIGPKQSVSYLISLRKFFGFSADFLQQAGQPKQDKSIQTLSKPRIWENCFTCLTLPMNGYQ